MARRKALSTPLLTTSEATGSTAGATPTAFIRPRRHTLSVGMQDASLTSSPSSFMFESPGDSSLDEDGGTGQVAEDDHLDQVARLEPHHHEVGMTADYITIYSSCSDDGFGHSALQSSISEGVGTSDRDAAAERKAIALRRVLASKRSTGTYNLQSFTIQSPLLMELLREILEGYPGSYSFHEKPLVFTANFEPLIHRWPALRTAIAGLEKRRDEGEADENIKDRISHAKLLDKLLVKEFEELEKAMNDMRNHRIVTFPHLWTIFPPNIVIYAKENDVDRAFLLRRTRYGVDGYNIPCFYLTCEFLDFDGDKFGMNTSILSIPEFTGPKPLTSLPMYPLDLHEKPADTKSKLMELGSRVEALAGTYYKNYNGSGFIRHSTGLMEKCNVKGRIVIDALSFNRLRPSVATHVAPFTTSSISNNDSANSGSGGRPMPILDGVLAGDKETRNLPALSEEQRLICSPLLPGYSLENKQWLDFTVSGVSDISFNGRAFSALNLPSNHKDLILGLATTKNLHGNQFDDVIQGKGKGMVVLLSGPSGVGKTLTVEALAEQMKVPLYTLAACELGLHPENIERRLQDTMSVCSRWGAILLLDEADIFLEHRDRHQLECNRLVSIFLRALEYYEGIMFLTTNRVEILDQAFQSRIHISLQYPEHDWESRKSIWKTFLARHNTIQAAAREKMMTTAPFHAIEMSTNRPATDSGLDTDDDAGGKMCAPDDSCLLITQPHQVVPKDLDRLADMKLNGRQIRNFLKTAQLLAIHKKEPLSYSHIDAVLSQTQYLHKATQATEQSRATIFN